MIFGTFDDFSNTVGAFGGYRMGRLVIGTLLAFTAALLVSTSQTIAASESRDVRCGKLGLQGSALSTLDTKVPQDLVILPGHSLKLVEGRQVAGPCVGEISNFITGQLILSSGAAFYLSKDGMRPDTEFRTPNRDGPKNLRVNPIDGYILVMSDRVTDISPPGEQRTSYVGLFKGPSDYLIAAFSLINGKPSQNFEVLIKSRKMITSIDYFPDPDTLSGRIGVVERAGPDIARLYDYAWAHGNLWELRSQPGNH